MPSITTTGAAKLASNSPLNRNTRVNLGPLTTKFSLDESCYGMFTSTLAQNPVGFWAKSCLRNGKVEDNTACWPPQTISSFNSFGVYSPGYICPSQYTSACSQATGTNVDRTLDIASFAFQFAPTGAETAVGCCPM